MKIIYNKIIPFGRYKAINLFGFLFVKRGIQLTPTLLNHESIHTYQWKELWYIGFFILYFLEWLFRSIQYLSFYKGYKNISFEKEAYYNQNDYSYLDNREKHSWKFYI